MVFSESQRAGTRPHTAPKSENYLALAEFLCRRILSRSHREFQDLLAEAMLGLVEAERTYDPSRGEFSTWASWKIRGRFSSFLRKLDRRGITMIENPRYDLFCDREIYPEDAMSRERDPYDAAADCELGPMLESLPRRNAEAIRLRYLKGLSISEIARRKKKKRGCISMRIAAGLQMLRSKYAEN